MITAQPAIAKSRKNQGQQEQQQQQQQEHFSLQHLPEYFYDLDKDDEDDEDDYFEEAPASESFAMVLERRRPYRPHETMHENSDRDDFGDGNKDRFIELAQAALEEATLEDERKGVIYEVVEALIAKTGAPLVAEVISEQLRSQEVIEKLAESHEEEEEQRRRRSKQNVFAPSLLKEPPDAVLQPAEYEVDEDGNTTPTSIANSHRGGSFTAAIASSSNNRRWLISEYIWRLFRILLLASLVGLVYHFMCAYHQNLF